MTRENIIVVGVCAMMLLVVLTVGCIEGGETKVTELTLIGLEKLTADDELNIVNWTVQGINGKPKLDSVDWEVKDDLGEAVWSGKAMRYTEAPDAMGVYYIDVNKNGLIDVGDTFCVKAPGDGHFTLRWFIAGNIGEYMADY